MAGDWIKMRTGLGTSPKVVRLASALKADRFRIVGGLHSAWCLFDAHSEDGALQGYTVDVLDELIGWAGFSAALASVGWLEIDGDTLRLPRFDAHNGQSAKRRAQDSDRKRIERQSASKADARPENFCSREEKRREEKAESKATVHSAAPTAPLDGLGIDGQGPKPEAPEPEADAETSLPKRIAGTKKKAAAVRFPEWYAAYPVKKGRALAEKAWKKAGGDDMADQLIAHVRRMEREDDTWLRGFLPHPATYLNGERWTDEPMKDKPQGASTAAAPAPETFGAKAALVQSETKLERELGYIRQQYNVGAYGEGADAKKKAGELMADAQRKYGGGA